MNPFVRPKRDEVRAGVRAEVPTLKQSGSSVTLRLNEPIDSYGGYWGVSAKEFTQTLDELADDVTEIVLRINSPGGEVFEALAILNALRAHPARVVAVVEGLAASSASFIAAGVDECQVMDNAEMFVHKAWGLTVGNADDMTKAAADLTHFDSNIATIYAAKSGGQVADWLQVMAAGRWYSAAEAVEAGLADAVVAAETTGADGARARFDLSVFARRVEPAAAAVAPQVPPTQSGQGKPLQEGSDMSELLMAGLRERLGIPAENELNEEGLLAALDEALTERAEDEAVTPPDGSTVVLDAARFAELEAAAADGREARAEQISARREAIVNRAVSEGRITPANRQVWRDRLDENEEGTAALLATLQPSVPLDAIGYTGGVGESTDDDLVIRAGWSGKERVA